MQPHAADDTALAHLPGLGPASAAMLGRVGVHDLAALRARDPVALYLAVRAREPRASLNLLYGIVAAREGVDWRRVARERRTALLAEIDARTTPPTPRSLR
jgi:DNA transformation protein and related proteins